MSGTVKLGFILLVGVIAGSMLLSLAKHLVTLVMPLAVIAGIGLIIYGMINKGTSPRY